MICARCGGPFVPGQATVVGRSAVHLEHWLADPGSASHDELYPPPCSGEHLTHVVRAGPADDVPAEASAALSLSIARDCGRSTPTEGD